jgi:hypothetical protein
MDYIFDDILTTNSLISDIIIPLVSCVGQNLIGDVTGPGGVFWETWYNPGMIEQNAYINCPDGTLATGPCNTELADRGILMENRILGLPRLRQVASCFQHDGKRQPSSFL